MVQIVTKPKKKVTLKHRGTVHTPETLEPSGPETLLSPAVMQMPEETKLALGTDPEARKRSKLIGLGLPDVKKAVKEKKKPRKRGRTIRRVASALGEDETLG